MVSAGDNISALEELEFRRDGVETNLGELRGSGPLVLIFLRHFG